MGADHVSVCIFQRNGGACDLRADAHHDDALRGRGAEVLRHGRSARADKDAAADGSAGIKVKDRGVAAVGTRNSGDAAADLHRTVCVDAVTRCLDVHGAVRNDDLACRGSKRAEAGATAHSGRIVAACGVDAVVGSGDRNIAARDHDRAALNAFIALGDGEGGRIARDGNIGVGVHAVIARGQGIVAARERHGAVGMDAVIFGIKGKGAAADENVRTRFQSLVGLVGRGHGSAAAVARLDGEVDILDLQDRFCLYAVICRGDMDRAAVQVDVAARGILVVIRADTVAARLNRDIAAVDLDAVFAVQTDVIGSDLQRARGDDEVILRDDAVLVVTVDFERARAVDRQIGTAEDRCIQLGTAVRDRVACTVGKRVDGSRVQRDGDFVSGLDIQGRPFAVLHGDAV